MIPYTSIPLISACFLVMVGVLIGHLIWYRYRDEQEQKAVGLHREIDDLRSSLNVQSTDTARRNGVIQQRRKRKLARLTAVKQRWRQY